MLIILKSLNGYFLLAVNLSKRKKKKEKGEKKTEKKQRKRERGRNETNRNKNDRVHLSAGKQQFSDFCSRFG